MDGIASVTQFLFTQQAIYKAMMACILKTIDRLDQGWTGTYVPEEKRKDGGRFMRIEKAITLTLVLLDSIRSAKSES